MNKDRLIEKWRNEYMAENPDRVPDFDSHDVLEWLAGKQIGIEQKVADLQQVIKDLLNDFEKDTGRQVSGISLISFEPECGKRLLVRTEITLK